MKPEYGTDLLMALMGSSYAYERVGLLWAARSNALAAVERSLSVFHYKGKVILQALNSVNRLVRIELRLGRIPHILKCVALGDAVASHLEFSENQEKMYHEERMMQEGVLGIYFLSLPVDALQDMSFLPDALEQLELDIARMALMFSLGHEQILREEGYIPVDENPIDVNRYFETWRDQPAIEHITPQPILGVGPASLLRSTILGIEIVAEVSNNIVSFGIAESFLGALEAFLATSNERDIFPCSESLTIVVRPLAEMTGLPQLRFLDDDTCSAEITHPVGFDSNDNAIRQVFIEWLQDSIIEIACRVLVIRDIELWLENLVVQEHGLSRALNLSDALVMTRNVFGEKPQFLLADWVKPDYKRYDVLRSSPWRVTKPIDSDEREVSPHSNEDLPQSAFPDISCLKHTDRRVLAPIDMPLWDRARWGGMMFLYDPNSPPLLAFIFEDGESGQAIFRAWQKRWGDEDKDDELRLAIIVGLSRLNPTEYGVIVGPNPDHVDEHKGMMHYLVSRINRMIPADSANLDKFISAYREKGRFLLTYAQSVAGRSMSLGQVMIAKRDLHICQAWEIDENDPDAIILSEDDDPIIPIGMVDPPVNRALSKIRVLRKADSDRQ